MKKLVGGVVFIAIILGGILGYKVVYKASPRDFITKETRIIYANEGVNTKNFTPLLPLLAYKKEKEELIEHLSAGNGSQEDNTIISKNGGKQ